MFQPRLEVRHLRMLQVMSRTGNITHAAVALCLTQSALSHQIREAERRLGLKLFVRGNKHLVALGGSPLSAKRGAFFGSSYQQGPVCRLVRRSPQIGAAGQSRVAAGDCPAILVRE
jgi:hypothetical protein